MPRIVRKKKIVNPRLQLRIISQFVAAALAMTLIQTLLLNQSMMTLVHELPHDERVLLEAWPSILLTNVGVAIALMVPLMLGIGILVTFRIAGPAYRFEQHLKAMVQGENPGPCRLRKGDEMTEVAALLTQLCEQMEGGPRTDTESPQPSTIYPEATPADFDPPAPLPGGLGDREHDAEL